MSPRRPDDPPFEEISEEGLFQAADSGADRVAGKIRRIFLGIIREIKRDGLGGSALDLAIEHGDSGYAQGVVQSLAISQRIREQLEDTGQKAEGDSLLDEAILIGLSLGVAALNAEFSEAEMARIRDRARQFVASEVSTQLAEIDRQTALGLALAILLVFQFRSPTEEVESAAARTFRPDIFTALFGLNRKQVQAIVGQAQASLVAGLPPTTVRRFLIDGARVALGDRADLIARSISERAINLAQQATIEGAVETGLIGLGTHARQWISRADGHVCPRCRDFHLVTARIDQPFRSRRGEVAWVPDVHPAGRCRMRVIELSLLESGAA